MLAEGQMDDLAERFVLFANEATADSPLYGLLASSAADDPAALQLLRHAEDPRQRRPNLLFAAVHDMLLAGVDHPLADYYPSTGGSRPPDHQAPEQFAQFLRDYEDDIALRVAGRSTQTNEVGRCASLWPGLWQAIEPDSDRPIALVELGSSAGLLLHLDRYRYDYAGTFSGAAGSRVTIAPEVVGGPPPVATATVQVRYRVGIDLSPLDPSNAEDARWLQACTWPEHQARRARLGAALEVARTHHDVHVVVGDLIERLPDVLDDIDSALLPVVMHSAALAYLDEAARARVAQILDEFGATRDLAVMSFEATFLDPWKTLHDRLCDSPDVEVFLTGLATWTAGVRRDRLLARGHPHGRWVQWLSDPLARGSAYLERRTESGTACHAVSASNDVLGTVACQPRGTQE